MSTKTLKDFQSERATIVKQLEEIDECIVKLSKHEQIRVFISEASFKSCEGPFEKSLTRGLEAEFNDVCEIVRTRLKSIYIDQYFAIISIEVSDINFDSTLIGLLEAYSILIRSKFDVKTWFKFSK